MKSRNLNRNLRIVLEISGARESGQKRLGMLKEYLEGHCGYRVWIMGRMEKLNSERYLGVSLHKAFLISSYKFFGKEVNFN